MPYVQDIIEPLIKTLDHTAGLPVHQLAGHVANLEFWVGEVDHAFQVIDGYPKRFKNLRQGERRYAETHPVWYGAARVGPSTRDDELTVLRRELTESITRVLNRCLKEGLLSGSEIETFARRLSLHPEGF